MIITPRMTAVAVSVLLGAGALGALTGCAAEPTGDAADAPQQARPTVAQQADPVEGEPDGPADPAQDTRIDGVAVSADGPSPGNLSIALEDDGTWCKGATLFWGEPVVADGIVFTIESISGPALDVDDSGCGERPPCIGEQIAAGGSVECSIRMTASDDFVEVTELAMTGSVTCPTAEACDTVRDRVAAPGDRLWMCSPSWVADGHDCRPESG